MKDAKWMGRRQAPRRKALYTRNDLHGIPFLEGLPGERPFLRGAYRTMYTERPWTIRQYAGFANAADSNRFLRDSLQRGAQGLSVAFDLPTHRGYDSDHPAAAADVGMAGVAIDSVEDMKRLFDGINLAETSVSMTMSGAVLPIMACFIVAAEEAGVPKSKLRGTIQNDILKEFIARNAFIYGPGPSLQIAADVVEYITRHMPHFNAMSISGYHFQEAGADAGLELALTMANGAAYVDMLKRRGLDLDTFCQRISFFFGVGRDFYQEIAKLRAARVLWSEVVAAAGGTLDKAHALRMHCQTSGWSLSAQQPLNNITRTTVQAMAAVFGGTQSLHTNSYDEALALPGDGAARLARDTQLILQQETGICDVVDPWAGSYMMERLTHDTVSRARELMEEIAAQGGVVQAMESGWITSLIDAAAARVQAQIDLGTYRIIGATGNFPTRDDGSYQLDAIRSIDNAAVREQQRLSLTAVRASRDEAAIRRTLDRLTQAATEGKANLLETTIEAIRTRATLGECSAALEVVWKRHEKRLTWSTNNYMQARQDDERWQRIREQVAQLAATMGRSPRMLIVKLGQDGHDRGAKTVASALADAGFDVKLSDLFLCPEAAVDIIRVTEVDLIGVSTMAGGHLSLVPRFLSLLVEIGKNDTPVCVGGVVPIEDHSKLFEAGVSRIFTPGTSIDDIISSMLIVLRYRNSASAEPRVETSELC